MGDELNALDAWVERAEQAESRERELRGALERARDDLAALALPAKMSDPYRQAAAKAAHERVAALLANQDRADGR